MRLKLLKLVTILLLAGSGESRPQNSAPQEGRADENGNGWKPIPLANEDVSQTVLSNSRYLGNGRNSRLIYHNYNYQTIPLSLSPAIKLNYSTFGASRSLDDNLYNYQLSNKWKGKTYPQKRIDDKSEKIRGYSPQISHFGTNVIRQVSSNVIPIPISSHVSPDNFSIRPANQGQRKIIEPDHHKSVFEGRQISSRTRNYVKIIPYNHIPNRGKNSNRIFKNSTKTKDKVNIVKASLNSQIKTENSNRVDRPPNLLTKENFIPNRSATPRPNSKVAASIPLKKWPAEVAPNIQDLYNSEKYFSSQEMKKPSNHKFPAGSSMEEMIQWLRIPAFSTNQSHMIDEHSGKPISNTFEPIYEDFEPNAPLRPIDESLDDKIDFPTQNQKPFFKPQYYFSSPQLDTMINSLQDPSLTRQPVYKPTTQVVQDTVVHIMNPGSKKPNVTITGSKKPDKVPENNGTSGSPPNVHIMFMNDPNPSNNSKSPSIVRDDCPTIMINSITKVNNKIESKEGCTDLNIVINSQILNTNVFTSSASSIPTESQKQPDLPFTGDPLFQSRPTNVPVFQSEPTTILDPGYSAQVDSHQQVKIQNPQVTTNPANSVEIVSGTKISIGSPEVLDDESNFDSGSDETSVSSDQTSVSDQSEGLKDEIEQLDQLPGTEELPIEVESASEAGNDAATIATTTIESSDDNSTAFSSNSTGNEEGLSSSPIGTGPGQANEGSSGVTLTGLRPSVPNLSPLMNVAGSQAMSQLSGSNGLGSAPNAPPGGAGAGAVADYDEDDDYFDYDDFDLSPYGMMDSMTSLFSSFSYMNPLNYGLMNVSIAPFAAFAAGVLGVAAFLFPWAFPGALDLGRSADRADVRFTPGIEEIVKQAIRKYRNWNEWKSKRRKRRKR